MDELKEQIETPPYLQKQKNDVITRFQRFWDGLTGQEQSDLWDVMTALRGPDSDNMELKRKTTAVIRTYIVKHSGFGDVNFHDDLPSEEELAKLDEANKFNLGMDGRLINEWHTVQHIIAAVKTIRRLNPDKRKVG